MTTEPASPELALVDDELRRRLLLELESDPLPWLIRPQRRDRVALSDRSAQWLNDGDGSYRRHLTSPLVVAICSSILTLAATFGFLSLRSDRRSTSLSGPVRAAQQAARATEAAHAPASATVPATVPATVGAAARPSGPARHSSTVRAKPARTLRFSWPPAAGSSSYEVAFYTRGRGGRLVLELTTYSPVAVVPVQRTVGKSPRALTPGRYRWYVWPVRGRRRDRVAIVQSTLKVS